MNKSKNLPSINTNDKKALNNDDGKMAIYKSTEFKNSKSFMVPIKRWQSIENKMTNHELRKIKYRKNLLQHKRINSFGAAAAAVSLSSSQDFSNYNTLRVSSKA